MARKPAEETRQWLAKALRRERPVRGSKRQRERMWCGPVCSGLLEEVLELEAEYGAQTYEEVDGGRPLFTEHVVEHGA